MQARAQGYVNGRGSPVCRSCEYGQAVGAVKVPAFCNQRQGSDARGAPDREAERGACPAEHPDPGAARRHAFSSPLCFAAPTSPFLAPVPSCRARRDASGVCFVLFSEEAKLPEVTAGNTSTTWQSEAPPQHSAARANRGIWPGTRSASAPSAGTDFRGCTPRVPACARAIGLGMCGKSGGERERGKERDVGMGLGGYAVLAVEGCHISWILASVLRWCTEENA